MYPVIPLDKILERMRREPPDGHPPLRIHAPQPEPPRISEPPREDEDEVQERGVAIIDFTI